MSTGPEARRFLRGRRHGTLATLSKRLAGYPFGSVTPFVLDHAARPIILISTLAEHTKNVDADPRASLIAFESGDDSLVNTQANARVTVVGDCTRLADQDAPRARYLRYFPDAAGYFDTHDFYFYSLEPHHVRFIGGFGKIHWVSAEAWHAPTNRLAELEDGILTHMNVDHADNLREYCRHVHGVSPQAVEMLGIDSDGFDMRADGRVLRFEFESPVTDAQSARNVLVELAQRCRL